MHIEFAIHFLFQFLLSFAIGFAELFVQNLSYNFPLLTSLNGLDKRLIMECERRVIRVYGDVVDRLVRGVDAVWLYATLMVSDSLAYAVRQIDDTSSDVKRLDELILLPPVQE